MTGPVITPRENYAFAVWRKGKPMPHGRENSIEAARAEAQRQAQERPGAKIVILQEIERIHVPKSNTAPASCRGDGGGVPKAPDAKAGEVVVAPANVNEGRAPSGGCKPGRIVASNPANPAPSSDPLGAPRQVEEPGGFIPPLPPGSPPQQQEPET